MPGDKEQKLQDYQDLMRFRIRDILLVSSMYDAFILEEDGGLTEQIYGTAVSSEQYAGQQGGGETG